VFFCGRPRALFCQPARRNIQPGKIHSNPASTGIRPRDDPSGIFSSVTLNRANLRTIERDSGRAIESQLGKKNPSILAIENTPVSGPGRPFLRSASGSLPLTGAIDHPPDEVGSTGHEDDFQKVS
jgi:hypothetical protein